MSIFTAAALGFSTLPASHSFLYDACWLSLSSPKLWFSWFSLRRATLPFCLGCWECYIMRPWILFHFPLEQAVSSLRGSTRVGRLCGQFPAEPPAPSRQKWLLTPAASLRLGRQRFAFPLALQTPSQWKRRTGCAVFLPLSLAARLPRRRDGRSGDANPTAMLLQVGPRQRRFLCSFALSRPGSSVVKRRTWEVWATQLHLELEVQMWHDLSVLSLQNDY